MNIVVNFQMQKKAGISLYFLYSHDQREYHIYSFHPHLLYPTSYYCGRMKVFLVCAKV